MDTALKTAADTAQTVQKATMSIGDSLVLAIVGMLIVFFVLVVLMAVIKGIRGVIASMEAGAAAAAPVAAAAAAPAAPAKPAANMIPAKGSLGDIMLHTVDDKTAALIMAIVADELKAPLNELRFLSIREKN